MQDGADSGLQAAFRQNDRGSSARDIHMPDTAEYVRRDNRNLSEFVWAESRDEGSR